MRRGASLSSQPNFNVGNSLHSPKNFNLTHCFIPFGTDSCAVLLCSVEQLPFSPCIWLFSSNGQCYCQVLKIHHLHLLLLCITLSGVQQSFRFFHICYSYLSGIKLQLPGTSVGLALFQTRQEARQPPLIFHFIYMELQTHSKKSQTTEENLNSLKSS